MRFDAAALDARQNSFLKVAFWYGGGNDAFRFGETSRHVADFDVDQLGMPLPKGECAQIVERHEGRRKYFHRVRTARGSRW